MTHVVTDLFVYGTLLPGDVRWPLLERYVTGEGRPDAVSGLLYDTGLDYPAAIFDESATELILGRRYS
ncbi:MAG: gamma-glutamylcyclotransferase, partial [Actinomycetota bacterium]